MQKTERVKGKSLLGVHPICWHAWIKYATMPFGKATRDQLPGRSWSASHLQPSCFELLDNSFQAFICLAIERKDFAADPIRHDSSVHIPRSHCSARPSGRPRHLGLATTSKWSTPSRPDHDGRLSCHLEGHCLLLVASSAKLGWPVLRVERFQAPEDLETSRIRISAWLLP